MISAAFPYQKKRWCVLGSEMAYVDSFAEESRSLLKQIPRGRSYILYSGAATTDRIATDFDAQGHIDVAVLQKTGIARKADFYLCGPSSFLENMRHGLQNWGVPAEHVHTEIFGTLESITPGTARVDHTPHPPGGSPGTGPSVSFARSGITVAWDGKFESLLELAERATFRLGGRAGLEFVTPA